MEDSTNTLSRLKGLWTFPVPGVANWADILLVAGLFFLLFRIIRGRQAWRVIMGTGVFLSALVLSDWLKLHALNFLLDKATLLVPVALAILLLPELRQAIEGMARLGVWSERLWSPEPKASVAMVDQVLQAVGALAEKRTGALIVFERNGKLDEFIATGIQMGAHLSASLLEATFYGENPLHDGAVIIRGQTVVSAACRLPLSESASIAQHMHMRHRAAVGISEVADCVVVVVSEERGRVSVARGGKLEEMPNLQSLRQTLQSSLGADPLTKKGRDKQEKEEEALEVP